MRYLSILFAALLLTACGDSSQESSESTTDSATQELAGRVRVDGSSTVFPISEAVAEEFRAVAPKVRVTVGVSGTGGGFKKFLNSETDINDASRPIKESEVDRAMETGIGYIELPVAFDGLSVVISKENTFIDHLTVEELNRIWKPDSEVKAWNDVRDGWPEEPIRLYGPGTDSGTFDYFTEVINGKSQASRADFTASEDDNVLVQGIAGDQYALGYFGYAYYLENKDKLKVVPIDGGNGPIEPTAETINNGTYAPLSRPVFIYVNPGSLDDPAVARFVDFYIDTAADMASEVGYIGMPEVVYERARQRVANRESGSAYHGSQKVADITQE
jgi:phosphate transport system substrate-binding protein